MFNKVAIGLAMVLLIAPMGIGDSGKPCQKCSCVPTNEPTELGNQHMVIDSRSYPPVRRLKGVVKDVLLVPLPDAIVELYPYQNDDPLPGFQGTERTRLAACLTGEDGAFQFDAPSGLYEVRVTKKWFNRTSVLVVLDTRKGKHRVMEVPLHVGT